MTYSKANICHPLGSKATERNELRCVWVCEREQEMQCNKDKKRQSKEKVRESNDDWRIVAVSDIDSVQLRKVFLSWKLFFSLKTWPAALSFSFKQSVTTVHGSAKHWGFLSERHVLPLGENSISSTSPVITNIDFFPNDPSTSGFLQWFRFSSFILLQLSSSAYKTSSDCD